MLAEPIRAETVASPEPRRAAARVWPWPAVALIVVGLAAAWVVVTGMRPAYDAYGWLVWGHQALHLNLDLNAAPSWKPLTFLFALPYALAGDGAVFLWMLTAVTGAFAAPVFAARVATGSQRRRGLRSGRRSRLPLPGSGSSASPATGTSC